MYILFSKFLNLTNKDEENFYQVAPLDDYHDDTRSLKEIPKKGKVVIQPQWKDLSNDSIYEEMNWFSIDLNHVI